NIGEIADAEGIGEVGNIVCGDAMKLYVKLADDKKTIADVKFQTFGCASAIASSSALTEMLKGKTLADAAKLTNQDIADFLGELPEEKMHCSVMGMEAFQAALIDMHKKHPDWNVPVVIEEEGENRIVCQCFSVTEARIREAIKTNHLTTVEQVTHYTKAGGGCGGCKPDIQEILDDINGNKKKSSDDSAAARPPSQLTNLQKIALIQSTFDDIIRPGLKADGGDAQLIDIDGNNVMVKLAGRCASCPSAIQTLKHWVEAKLREKVSGALNVVEVK
ncbi:MAG: Fe-S cluster assembly protein NifU, partial [Lentisphaerae bacterium]|nr:Fe-S cluster assembly protein NifU [Lentisphaerota bacterium]